MKSMWLGLAGFMYRRLKEPSTWAGMAAIAVSLGHPGGGALIGSLSEWVVPLLGAAAIALPEANTESASSDDGGGA